MLFSCLHKPHSYSYPQATDRNASFTALWDRFCDHRTIPETNIHISPKVVQTSGFSARGGGGGSHCQTDSKMEKSETPGYPYPRYYHRTSVDWSAECNTSVPLRPGGTTSAAVRPWHWWGTRWPPGPARSGWRWSWRRGRRALPSTYGTRQSRWC